MIKFCSTICSNSQMTKRKLLFYNYLRFILAEGKGFEPLIGFLLYTLSRRASSTTPAPLRKGCKNTISILGTE